MELGKIAFMIDNVWSINIVRYGPIT